MARSSKMSYDPQTGKWTKSVVETKDKTNNKSKNKSRNTKGNTKPPQQKKSESGNLSSDSSDSKDSKGSVEKKYNNIEINTLTGSLSVIPNTTTIKIKAGDTIKLAGLGKYLSGKYYVKTVNRTLDSNGYSQTLEVIKTDFGKSLKTITKKSKGKTKLKKGKGVVLGAKTVSSAKTAKTAKRTHTVKKGEGVYSISKKYYGDGSKYTKIYDFNTGKPITKKSLYVGQVLVIP